MPYSVDLLIDLITASIPDERQPTWDQDPRGAGKACPTDMHGKPGNI